MKKVKNRRRKKLYTLCFKRLKKILPYKYIYFKPDNVMDEKP